MKKLLILPVLGIAFFPLLTSADSLTDCQNDETCGMCILESQTSCDLDFNCTAVGDPSMCDMIEDEGEREQCMSDIESSMANCESDRDVCYINGQTSCVNQYFPNSGGGSEGGNGGSPIAGGVLNGTQLVNMGTALTQGGSSLLKIGIQLMPYMIAFTIILLIFRLIKNWSKLKNKGLGDSYYAGSRVKRNYGFDVSQDEIDLLNFYEKEEGNFDGTGKYYRASNGKVAYRYKYDGKWYTSYDSDEAIIDDILPDKEHHYKKRHGLYND